MSSPTNDPTYLGTIQDVKGATISVALDINTVSGLAFVQGHGYRIGQVGSFVRVPMGYVDLFGIISQVGASAVPERIAVNEPYGLRWITVQLVGESQGRSDFRRGLSQYPTIGDAVHLVTESDLARVYGRADAPGFVRIGRLASADSIPSLVDVDKLVTRHSAVVGATGAGKSTTVTSLLRALTDSKAYESARVVVLDIHGEYASALRDRATVFRIQANTGHSERTLHVPYWAMTFDELLPLTFGNLDDASRGAVLEHITAAKLESISKKARPGVTESNLTVDSPIPFSIHKLWFDLHRRVNATHTAQQAAQTSETEALELDVEGKAVQSGDAMRVVAPRYRPIAPQQVYLSASSLNIRRQVESLASKLRDPRYDFLFRPGPWCPNTDGLPEKDLDALLADWIGGLAPITILDLSGVPVSILTNLVGAVLRIIYDALFWARNLSEGGRERPLLVVLEEAHAYLMQGDTGPAAQAVRRIVKEGRKYGIGAMIVSQRPAEVDATILSQCGTIFALRLSNPADRGHVMGAVTDNLEGLLSMLPALRTGETIIMGEAVRLPIRALIDMPPKNHRPDSRDPVVYDNRGPGGWNRAREPNDFAEVVAVWRTQDPRSPRIIRTQTAKEATNG